MNKKRGFTIIELVIYVAILGLMSITLLSFAVSTVTARTKNRAIEEVNANGRAVIELMSQKIRAAKASTFPAPNTSNTVMVLDMPDPQPDCFFLILNGVLTYGDSSVGLQPIINSKVVIESLNFQNFAPNTNERDAIKITMTLRSAEDPNTAYRKVFTTTVSTRL